MPSGAKKRKAAKKKREQEANITSSTNNNSNNNTNKTSNNTPLGNDDPKSQDERESDGGDTGSPASQDHHNQQHPFDKGNEESEKRDSKSTVQVTQDIKGNAEVGTEGNGAIKIQRELESKNDLGGQNISIEHVEFEKESPDGSSSSSSSDNEPQAVQKASKKVILDTEKASSGKVDDSVVENAPAIDSVKPLVTVAPDLVESRLKENEKSNEDEVIPLSEESVEVSWTVVEPVTNNNEGKNLPFSALAESSNGAGNTRDSKFNVSSENQPLLASDPRVEQRTSWLSCCGLCDVLTGSSR